MKTIYLLLLALPQLAHSACEEGDFVFVDDGTVQIGINGRGYSPSCLQVRPGIQVTIQASQGHPLQGVPNAPGQPANPFARGTEGVVPDTQVLSSSGSYRYFCTRHGDADGNGMAGEIRVR